MQRGGAQLLGGPPTSAMGSPLIFGHKYGLAALALIAWLSAGSKSEVGRLAGKMQRETSMGRVARL